MLSEPAASPARWIDVAPERFPGWIESFAGRHGAVQVADEPGDAEPDGAVVFVAADGAVARAHAPFPPVPGLTGARKPGDGEPVGQGSVGQDSVGQGFLGQDPGEVARVIAAHAAAGRTVGVLLVRLGGYAAYATLAVDYIDAMRQRVLQVAREQGRLPVVDRLVVQPCPGLSAPHDPNYNLCRTAADAVTKVLADHPETFEVSADRSGQVKHPVDAGEKRPDHSEVGDISLHQLEVRRLRVRCEGFGAADREIVDDHDVMTIAEQAIDKVTSDETGAAGNDAFHDRTCPL